VEECALHRPLGMIERVPAAARRRLRDAARILHYNHSPMTRAVDRPEYARVRDPVAFAAACGNAARSPAPERSEEKPA
jgi:hypothetical protein